MNSSVKSILIFLSGAAVGGVATWYGVKKYYEAKADIEIDDMRQAFNKRMEDVEGVENSIDGDIKGPEELPSDYIKPSRSSISEKLNNKPPLVDYTSYFKSSKKASGEGTDPAELEHPEDDIPYTDEEDLDETLEFEDHELNGSHKDALASDKEPFVIEASDYELTCSNYDKLSLLYYISDDIVVNEENEIVSDTFRLIGEVIGKSGFDENEDDVLYVRNDKLMCDFEITKIYTAFE